MIRKVHRLPTEPTLITITHTNRNLQLRITRIPFPTPINLHFLLRTHVNKIRIIRQLIQPTNTISLHSPHILHQTRRP